MTKSIKQLGTIDNSLQKRADIVVLLDSCGESASEGNWEKGRSLGMRLSAYRIRESIDTCTHARAPIWYVRGFRAILEFLEYCVFFFPPIPHFIFARFAYKPLILPTISDKLDCHFSVKQQMIVKKIEANHSFSWSLLNDGTVSWNSVDRVARLVRPKSPPHSNPPDPT